MTTLLMTGATGFAGRAVVNEVLTRTDWNIASFQRECGKFESERVVEIPWDFKHPMLEAYMRVPVDADMFFLHLGADVHALRSLKDPASFVETNVMGTANVLDLARRMDVDLFAYVSTGEVFGGRDDGYSNEEDPHRPSNPYAATKAAGELLTYSYHRAFDLPAIIVRTLNIFSMDQKDPSKFVPIVRKALETGETMKLHAKDGRPGVRQWLHVTAFANQLVDLLKTATIGKSYHLYGEELNNLQMAQRVATELGKELKYEFIRMPKTHEYRYAMARNR